VKGMKRKRKATGCEMDKKRKVIGIQNKKCKWLHKAISYGTRWFQGRT
jgi:hypothetical protein